MSFTNKGLASWYKDLFHIDNGNSGVDTTVRTVKTGNGVSSSLGLSKNSTKIKPDRDGTNTFEVQDQSENTLFVIDTTNDLVKAGVGQHIANTNIKEFGLDFTSYSPDTADKWHCLTSSSNHTDNNELEMGTGSTPATTLTITDSAYVTVKHYWYVPFNISIDSCNVWFGGHNATGDVVKFSVMSYSVDSANGATGGDLSSGVENCASPSTITGEGKEQAYYQDLTVSTADVDAGKVIMACVSQDGTNSDLSVNMQLIYHLR